MHPVHSGSVSGFLRLFRKPVFLGLVPMLVFAGCSSVQLKLGMKVDLSKIPVTTMDAAMARDPAIAPGQKSPLVVTLTGPNGEVFKTEGAGKGKIMWKDLAVTASVVSVNKKGVLSLARDPRLSDGKMGHVTITAPSHPDLHAELDVPLRYNVKYVANFFGAKGLDGINGTDGLDGSMGSSGSMDPNNPSPGGNGGDGSNGGNGQDGGRGDDAPPVQVTLTLHPGPQTLLEAGVTAQGHKERFYLINPTGGSLFVSADGGAGGSGGKGGRGGHGGSGGIGTPNGMNGHDGLDGRAGFDGISGSGGSITVVYDPAIQPYLAILHLSNSGGPKPAFEEQPVAPLW
jgi:hypothetical protein